MAKGVAIMMVIAVHVNQSTSGTPVAFDWIANFGAMGVQMFFVVAGYCACMTTDGRRDQLLSHTEVGRYLFRRYKRLALPYVGAMIFYSVLRAFGIGSCGVDLQAPSIVDVLLNVLLLNTFWPSAQNSLVPGGWSISCIAVFSLAFPLIWSGVGAHVVRRSAVISVALIAISACLYYICGLTKQFCYMTVTTHICSFLVGVIYYKTRGCLSRQITDASLIGFSTVMIAVAALSVLFVQSAFLYRGCLVSVGFVGWLALMERHEQFFPRWIDLIGQHSYSIFILHFAVVLTLCPPLSKMLTGCHWLFRYSVGYCGVVMTAFVVSYVMAHDRWKKLLSNCTKGSRGE